MSDGGKWGDLSTRIFSATVLAALAVGALTGGDLVWGLFVLVILCAGFWELARLCEPEIAPRRQLAVGALPAVGLLPILVLGQGVALAEKFGAVSGAWVEKESIGAFSMALFGGILLILVLSVVLLRQRRVQAVIYGAALIGAGMFLVALRSDQGVNAVLALLAIVVISDVAGYFAGRMMGGPKFWPAISPKKTWSGTVAGWIGAGVFGAIVLPGFGLPLIWAVPVAVMLCFAAQMGDIAESAMKRKAGIKDSSNLIPGHGGVLDRMDGMVGAAAVGAAIAMIAG